MEAVSSFSSMGLRIRLLGLEISVESVHSSRQAARGLLFLLLVAWRGRENIFSSSDTIDLMHMRLIKGFVC